MADPTSGGEDIGTARVNVVVNTQSFDASVQASKRSVSDMSQAAQDAYNQLDTVEKRRVDNLVNQANQLGKTRAEQILYNAEMKNIPTAIFDDLAAKLKSAGSAAEEFSLASSGARRELGRLISDISQGNYGRFEQSSLTLANASGLLGKAFSVTGGLVIAAAAAVAIFVAGIIAGASETAKLQQAVVASGNALGASTGQLNDSAVAVGKITGQWGEARQAIELFASSGTTGGAGFAGLATQAVNMATVTGQSIDQVVAEIQKIGQDPTGEIAKLNEQYNFLTSAQYAEIAALQEEGKTRDAARLANQADADAMAQRAQQIQDNAGLLQRAAHDVVQAWDGAWDSIKGIGRAPSLGDQISNVQSQIQQLTTPHADRAGNLVQPQGGQQLQDLQAKLTSLQTQSATDAFTQSNNQLQAQLNQASIAAQASLSKYDTPKDVLDNTLKKANEDHLAALYGVVDPATVAKINAEYQDQVKTAHNTYLEATKKLEGPKTPNPFESLNGLVQHAQVNDNNFSADNNPQQNSAQTKQVQEILAIVDAGAKLIQSGHNVAQVQADVAAGVTAVNDLYAKEADQLTQRNIVAMQAYQAAIDEQVATKQKQIDIQVEAIGTGDKEIQQQEAIAAIYSKVDTTIEQLNRQRTQKDANVDLIDQQIAAQKASLPVLVKQQQDAYTQIDAAQSSWENGANKALQNFEDQSQNVANASSQAFTTLFDGLANGLATFVTTGKFNFASLATSFLTDVAKMEARVLESDVLSSIFSSFGGSVSYGGGAGAVSGSGAYSGFGASSTITTAFNAMGGVYTSADLSSYSGQVVNKPTTFAFANGAGLMGEAGPEAIMPLTRGSDGKLGVSAPGGGGGVQVNLAVNVDNSGAASTSTSSTSGDPAQSDIARQLGDRMKETSRQTIANEMRPGGLLWKMKNG